MESKTVQGEKTLRALSELENVAAILEAFPKHPELTLDLEFVCLSVFEEQINQINTVLGCIRHLGSNHIDHKSETWRNVAIEGFGRLIPVLSRIYDVRKDRWFVQKDTVIEHEMGYARTWSEVVLQTAKQVDFMARRISPLRSCEILDECGYESGRVNVHLEIEFEHAASALEPPDGTPEDSRFIGWFRVTEVAEILGINKGMVDRHIKARDFEDNKLTHSKRRIDPASFRDYCRRHQIPLNDP